MILMVAPVAVCNFTSLGLTGQNGENPALLTEDEQLDLVAP